MTLRVLLVDRSDRGGIATYTGQLMTGLTAAGVDVRLCAPGARASGAPSLPHHRWGQEIAGASKATIWAGRMDEIPRAATAVARGIRAVHPDVVHAQTEILPRLDPVWWRLVRPFVPVVLTVHDPTPLEGGNRALQRAARLWRSVDAVIVHDDAGKRQIEAVAPRAAVGVVPFDLGAASRPSATLTRAEARRQLGLDDGPIVLQLGLIRPYKGYDLLAAAWPAVIAALPQASLHIVGDGGDDVPALASLEAIPGVRLRREWIDDLEVDLWASAADLVVTPYLLGSHSGVIDRATAVGTPVLASPVLAQQVERLGAGRVVELEPAAWSRNIIDALIAPIPPPPVPDGQLTVRATVAMYERVMATRAARPR